MGVKLPSAHPGSDSYGAAELKSLLLVTFLEKPLEQHSTSYIIETLHLYSAFILYFV